MGKLRTIAFVYMVILLAAASLNYIPGLTDAEGRAFGIFALDIFDDALHVASALWAGIAAVHRRSRASRIFLLLLRPALSDRRPARTRRPARATSISASSITACWICRSAFKILANLPHIGGGAFAVFASWRLRAPRRADCDGARLAGDGCSGELSKWPLLAGIAVLLRCCSCRSATSSSPAAVTAAARRRISH